ncbi:hypothetical protein ASPSYDRAFT_62441 [Aspergillus sydowii CBS 593.65]|uniref:FAD-binding domain-containing protein n=1 Tax=Aspergillus sydowii CBS 593.65 TaxID=1036612 RepID=A0A1L9SZU4_9EURO|nr:uncharacterized protein ASPSYDRAFT_62441 [Aspergillus sydowii CBS 593.65]OJJ52742.1 hypothetical protein ASPSYDRAFT_62441 [Aspergillus sydowii CBS 593.65]
MVRLHGLVISQAPGTADTPRAHTFNPFGFECLRDLGLEDAALQVAFRGEVFQSMRWCRSMNEDEYGRVRGWSEHPACRGEVESLSPCKHAEFPQSELEPLLVKYASHNNFNVRFSTELVNVERTTSRRYLCTVHDLISTQTFQIHADYLFGADGARSHVARSLGFSFSSQPSGGRACNVLLRADLGHIMHRERQTGLHWIVKCDRTTYPGMVAHMRMVRPWNEWIVVGFGEKGSNPFEGLTTQSPELVDCVRELIGDEGVDIEVVRVDPWTIRESIAESYSLSGENVFLLGDAAPRHPPAFGLGSNTCVQDAYNLAWKVAYVAKGLAGAGLLRSYSPERQPVGATLVRESNQGIRAHAQVWESLGTFAQTRAEGVEQLGRLSEATEEGETARANLDDALQRIGYEIQSLGIAYNQFYDSSAVHTQDEPGGRPQLEADPIVYPQITTYPGSRLPHAWLDVPTRQKTISTLDLAGKGAFCLLFGVGGDAWKQAARAVTAATGIPVHAYGIGFGLDYIDIHRDWAAKRGVEEGGCVLVRPDRFVAWRSPNVVSDCEGKLRRVLDQILSKHEL